MKYIKTFNEGLLDQSELDNIKDICEGTLAYLFDDVPGTINVSPYKGKLYDYINVEVKFNNFVSGTTWNKIEDYFISLYKRLNNDYDTMSIVKLDTLDIDADRETKCYDLDKSIFVSPIGKDLKSYGYKNKYDINKNLIFSVSFTLRDAFHKN